MNQEPERKELPDEEQPPTVDRAQLEREIRALAELLIDFYEDEKDRPAA